MTTTQAGLGWKWQQLCKRAWLLYGDVCHLCGKQGADTIDHLDPRATHGVRVPTLDRVRPAHRRCNARRGASPMQVSPRSRQW